MESGCCTGNSNGVPRAAVLGKFSLEAFDCRTLSQKIGTQYRPYSGDIIFANLLSSIRNHLQKSPIFAWLPATQACSSWIDIQ